MSARTVSLEGGAPWGFRMHGGADSNQPLRISRVNPGSKASLKGVREGDLITSINDRPTKDATNSASHALLKSAGDILKLGLNEDSSGSPKRRQYKTNTIKKETISSETIQRSNISTTTYELSQFSVKDDDLPKPEDDLVNNSEPSANPKKEPEQATKNPVKDGIASQRSTLSSNCSSSASTSSQLSDQKVPCNYQTGSRPRDAIAANATETKPASPSALIERAVLLSVAQQFNAMSDKNDDGSTRENSRPRRRRNKKKPGPKQISNSHVPEFTAVQPTTVPTTIENYRVDSPKNVKTTISKQKPNGCVVKSKSFDNDDVRIVELSETSDIEDGKAQIAESTAVVAEANSDVAWENTEDLTNLSVKEEVASLSTLTLSIEDPPFVVIESSISPEDEQNLRSFLEGIHLVTEPTYPILILEPTTSSTTNPGAIKLQRKQKREELIEYFGPAFQNPHYLDAISEEGSDLSDREANIRKSTFSLNIPISTSGTVCCNVPMLTEVCVSQLQEPSSSVEVVLLHDSDSSSDHEDVNEPIYENLANYKHKNSTDIGIADRPESNILEEDLQDPQIQVTNSETVEMTRSIEFSEINDEEDEEEQKMIKSIEQKDDMELDDLSNTITNLKAINNSEVLKSEPSINITNKDQIRGSCNFEVKYDKDDKVEESADDFVNTQTKQNEHINAISCVINNDSELQYGSTLDYLKATDESFQKEFKEMLKDMDTNQMYTHSRETDSTESSASESIGTTAKLNPLRQSIGNVESIASDEELAETLLLLKQPVSLKDSCLRLLLSLPFGNDVLAELAEVSNSLKYLTDYLKPVPVNYNNWNKLLVSDNENTVLCISASQKSYLDNCKVIPNEGAALLDLHCKYVNRIISEPPKISENGGDNVSNVTVIIQNQRKAPQENNILNNDDENHLLNIVQNETNSIPRDASNNRLQARDLNEWLALARNNCNTGTTENSSIPYVQHQQHQIPVEIARFTSAPPRQHQDQRRSSLPHEMFVDQMQRLIEQEKHIQQELECLEAEKRHLTAAIMHHKEFDVDNYKISKRGDIAILEDEFDRDTKSNMAAGSEVFRRRMYDEYLDKMAARAARKHQKIIKITTTDDSCTGTTSSGPNVMHIKKLETEFMEKVRKNMNKRGLPHDQQQHVDSGQKALEKEQSSNTLVITDSHDCDSVVLPRHLQDFVDITRLTSSSEDDASEDGLRYDRNAHRISKALSRNRPKFNLSLLHEIDEQLVLSKGFLLSRGIWSPGQQQHRNQGTDLQRQLSQDSSSTTATIREDEQDSVASQQSVAQVWTPRSAGSSPTVERKAFRQVNFESPTPARRTLKKQETLSDDTDASWMKPISSAVPKSNNTTLADKPFPTSRSAPGPDLRSSSSNLPKAQNPTITLLQKAREGQLPRGAAYIEEKTTQDIGSRSDRNLTDSRQFYGPRDTAYQIRSDYTSESDSERPRKMVDIRPITYESIGPTTKDGMSTALRSEIKDTNQAKWYKKMYDTIHKQKPRYDDEYVTIRYKQRRGRYPYNTSGYLSEPEPGAYDSDAALSDYNRYATLDRRRISNKENEYTATMSYTLPRNTTRSISYLPNDVTQHSRSLYRNQPGRIENYMPGHSSVSDKESKQHLEQQKRVPQFQPRGYMSQALRESGYESDSTLVFRRCEEALKQQLSPTEQKEVYRNIQKGGEVPLHGLRKPLPDRPKESPRKYVENDVTIHYKSPVRQEVKEALSEEELARRQAAAMTKLYEEERRRKYLQVSAQVHRDEGATVASSVVAQAVEPDLGAVSDNATATDELKDMNSRRHTDHFTAAQKSPISLNRYDDFVADQAPRIKTRPRSPEPRLVARALYNFVGQSGRELTFRKGDVIYIRRQVDKNWYEGEHNAAVGLFPANYVQIVPFDGITSTHRKPTEGHARARYNFIAQTHLELSLAKGELVVLIRRVDDNWYEGKIGGRKGIFPISYVEVLIEPNVDGATASVSKPVASPAAHSLLLNGSAGGKESMGSHTYIPSISTSQDLATSYRAKPVQLTGAGTYGSLKKNPVNQTLHIDTASEPVPYRALYKYRPQNDDELELLEGDTVYVLEKCDDGWFVGSSNRTGAFGTFPGNYVERI